MNIVSGILLYAVIWFWTLFMVLPVRLKSQADLGDVTLGTAASAPANPQIGKRMAITTVIATVVFAIVATIIITETVTLSDLSFFSEWMRAHYQR